LKKLTQRRWHISRAAAPEPAGSFVLADSRW